MHFNLFQGWREFTVTGASNITVCITTQQARQKLEKYAGSLVRFHSTILTMGDLILPVGTELTILHYSMPYGPKDCQFKLKLKFDKTSVKLGTFYIYTDPLSLEHIELEPR